MLLAVMPVQQPIPQEQWWSWRFPSAFPFTTSPPTERAPSEVTRAAASPGRSPERSCRAKYGGADWTARKRWYAILQRFEHDGSHTTSDIWCPGLGIRRGQQERLAQSLDALPGRVYSNIAIRPFQVEVEDVGLGGSEAAVLS